MEFKIILLNNFITMTMEQNYEILDENKEPILLKSICIMLKNIPIAQHILFDSKERFFVIELLNTCLVDKLFEYTQNTNGDIYLWYDCFNARHITNDVEILCRSKIVQNYYMNKSQYWPSFEIHNYILK